jgi:hypothetical protein
MPVWRLRYVLSGCREPTPTYSLGPPDLSAMSVWIFPDTALTSPIRAAFTDRTMDRNSGKVDVTNRVGVLTFIVDYQRNVPGLREFQALQK